MAHVLTDFSTAALIAAGEANYLEMARYMALGIYTRIGFTEYCRIASHAWQPGGHDAIADVNYHHRDCQGK